MTAYISTYIVGAIYVLVGYVIRIVLYALVYAAVWVFVVALVLDNKSDKFFKSESLKRESLPEQGDEAFPLRRNRIKVTTYLTPWRTSQ